MFGGENLEVLEILGKSLTSFPSGFLRTANPKSFKIRECHMPSIPQAISHMSNIQNLKLWGCKSLQSFLPEDDVGQLLNLTTLEIRRCGGDDSSDAVRLPSTIGQLTNLKSFTVDFCRVSSLPPSIGELANLEELTLSKIGVRSLPNEIGNLRKLKTLTIDDCNLESEIPVTIKNLCNLETLFLRGTSDFVNTLPFLPQLKSLEIRIHRISDGHDNFIIKIFDDVAWKMQGFTSFQSPARASLKKNGKSI